MRVIDTASLPRSGFGVRTSRHPSIDDDGDRCDGTAPGLDVAFSKQRSLAALSGNARHVSKMPAVPASCARATVQANASAVATTICRVLQKASSRARNGGIVGHFGARSSLNLP